MHAPLPSTARVGKSILLKPSTVEKKHTGRDLSVVSSERRLLTTVYWERLRQSSSENETIDERILELIMGVHGFLLMRDDYGRNEQRAFLVDFMVPALLVT